MIESHVLFNGFNYNIWPRDYGASGWFTRLVSVDGLADPTSTSESHKVPEDIGDRAYSSYNSSRPVTLGGELRARDMPHFNAGLWTAAESHWDKDTHQLQWTMKIAGALDLEVYMNARVNQPFACPITLDRADSVVGKYTVQLVADDPRIYKVSDNTLAFPWMV